MSESIQWTAKLTHRFLELLAERVKTTHDTAIRASDYRRISEQLQNVAQKKLEVQQLASKYQRLRSTYRSWHMLIEYTGFGWDHESQTPTRPKEIWEEYIKQNTGAQQFLHKGLVDRELYMVIFQKQNATGRFAFTSASELTASTMCFFYPTEADMNQDDFNPNLDRSTGEKRSNRSGDSRSINRRRRRRDGEGNPFLGVMTQWAEAISNKTMGSAASTHSGGDGTQENTSARTDRYSMENCQAILESMQLLPQLYLDVVKYLIANPEWRLLMVNMSHANRKFCVYNDICRT
ncbi:uncharacterized protein LOC116144099 [Pistacia vera]|uniref:uncharacterized protein LOC116144099 n=1 Tax=Pistacia vera TaxID=55513 RepID=UPI0012633CC2|nr:uncharacterized protein LOC116144099 [Pistacia vera]